MFNFRSMIRTFGVPLIVHLSSGKDNGSCNSAGEWQPNQQTSALELKEPLVPPSASQLSYSQQKGGNLELIDMLWYSEQQNMVLGTLVTDQRTNITYELTSVLDYQGYSTVAIYGLKAVQNIEHV